MAERIACYVMSGGVGSRLWPLSREDNPKQFHDFSGAGSMLRRTVRRMASRREGVTPVHVIAGERHAERVRADIAGIDLGGGTALYEPAGRNTAAAVALAALHALDRYGGGMVLVAPSDHEIAPDEAFWRTIDAGVPAAEAGALVVFGVQPNHPETGYGYIETETRVAPGDVAQVKRFVEKPDRATAESYVAAGSFYWNTGIFLFDAAAMARAFEAHQPEIWTRTAAALAASNEDVGGVWLPLDIYETIPSISIDYAIMERERDIAMTPATFRWNDLGSWQSLLEVSPSDENGNVAIGDVVAIDCERSYMRSEGRLLSVIGMKDVAVVATPDAIFIAPVSQSQNVRKVVGQLEKTGRLETRFTPSADRLPTPGAWRKRVRHWLFEEALPLWSTVGVDRVNGGFHEALSLEAQPLAKPKRTRTMARQTYAFAVAKARGWAGPADELIAHGVDFMKRGRMSSGGWARTLNIDGTVLDPVEDSYDTAFVLLALAHAHRAGHHEARRLGEETFAFLDARLEDASMTGFLETTGGDEMRRTNPHMHLLEAFLAWHAATRDKSYLRRAARVVDLFRSHFFDPETWTLGEYFRADWKPAAGEKGAWTEPGHHFEWAWLLVDFARVSGQKDLIRYARKLYASAVANGLNRTTGLAYGAVTRDGVPIDAISRSWPQTEVIKAAIALNGAGGPDLKPEIEARVARLFRWHIDAAPIGLWIDRVNEKGRAVAEDAPASIFYHLICALTEYLDATESAET